MTRFAVIGVLLVLLVAFRLWRHRHRRATGSATPAVARQMMQPSTGSPGAVRLVAAREIRERVSGRIFRVGTIIILLVVGAAIVIPVLHKSSVSAENVAVVGGDRAALERLVRAEAIRVGTTVDFVHEGSVSGAESDLRGGTLDLAVVDGTRIVVGQAIDPTDGSDTSNLVDAVSVALGVEQSYKAAGLTANQMQQLNSTKPVPVQSLEPAAKTHKVNGASVIGVILVFVMLTQYTTWILMGVMQEKASRVVEVLLATMRPMQLLSGKVLGIGLVAMGQAATVLVFALILAEAVGSDVLHGAEPVALAAALVWLLLGYTFYCWVYAAAGSMAERQDQVQTLALPLSLPMIVGYVIALTAASSGSASTFVKALAYFPPTAPFAMPVLVGLDQVQWWGFAISVLVTLASTVVVARFASGIYLRAVLRTGASVPLRELIRGGVA
jgi:ABC-2 type transport system permease protein